MSKRKREDTGDERSEKKQRKGFSVGPANLPDGTYRRKTQKIKEDLIQKAKVKKSYAKLRSHKDGQEEPVAKYDPYAEAEDPTRSIALVPQSAEEDEGTAIPEKTGEIHPQRQAMLDQPERPEPTHSQGRRRERKPRREKDGSNANHEAIAERKRDINKPARYKKEFAQADERKAQEEARQIARAQREKERKALIKARKPGKDGKIKLGRQSDVLLSRVQRLTGQA
ncbi:hypothetical protein LTS08_004219 [Lithohypha guttulata]|uniref:rRNA-processing protein FYV7 n=1 Tax=Lithohypha guttulata TaxID=1690604 RepID=A0AAN7Y6N2_9EURO|nr:hypothetical protein LTR51_005776 [Lithohypha guttulata]KAK5086473.1 hypothetical protein LTR05_003641 [Lithohypha guttulata]KAK5101760.1 hypothetical protein LTS08_004219 [Lithohypha guttulata]